MTESNHKSMDDVLASIRRIVSAERENSVTTATGNGSHKDNGARGEAEETLLLSPDMRTDGGGARASARPELAADRDEASASPEPPDREAPDQDALRAALREILREELAGGPAAEAVRGIVRDELTGGQIGRNISQNVLRLVRDEVAKAVQEPR